MSGRLFSIGDHVRYKPGAGVYGYEDVVEPDGRIPALVIGYSPTKVRIEFRAIKGASAVVIRSVAESSLLRA